MKIKLMVDRAAKQMALLQHMVTFQLLLFFSPAHAQFTPLFSFNGVEKGSSPAGSLIFDGTYLYGMTSQGGANNFGTIFKIKPDGSGYLKLLDFNGGNGRLPQGSLIFDGTFLYGMTYYGGSRGTGAMFKIKPDGTEYTKLWDFGGLSFRLPNAAYPYGSLLLDGGYLYGMASFGGINAGGVIFKIKPDGTGFTKLRDLYAGGIVRDGADPWGTLISDGTYLYGTARLGGTGLGGGWPEGAVFKIKPDGTGYSKLFDCSGPNGSEPTGDLLYDGTFLYGTTSSYGSGGGGAGTVFRVKPDGTEYSTLHNFDGVNGRLPRGSLISDGTFLYGMTSEGGTSNLGTLFKIMPDGTGFTKLMSFKGASTGSSPALGSLVSDGSFLYGMTYKGGANDLGVLFKYALGPWPNISSFSPSQGPVGTTVTITGSDFDPIAGNNVVLINGIRADVTFSTATSIITSVPLGATTGVITLTVGTKTTTSESDFIVSPPVITSFSPIAGPAETVVTIVGTDFDQTCGNNVVSFNGTPARVTDCTATSIIVSVPAKATTGNITVTVGSNTAISPISFKVVDRLVFAPKVDYPVYIGPKEIEVADFNLDGHLDIATPSAGTIAIQYGTGAGCFDTQLDVPASVTLSSIAASDLNFDGWIDLVGANGSTGTVSVFFNSAYGFYPAVDYASGPQSSMLTIGDVNADGAPDLVVVNNDTPGSISILINNFWGEFNAARQYPTTPYPNSITIGDVNRDSWADLVITNSSQSVSIFLNDGTGGFPTETQYPTTKISNGTVLNDFDRDSDLDVAVANNDGTSIDIMLNDGSGLYSIISDFQTNTTGYGPGSILAGDFNNDGNADLLTGSYDGMTSILLGDGSGWFAPGQTFTTGNGLTAINLGDVDEDGLPDVVSANSSDNTVSVLLSSGKACGGPTITGFTPSSAAVGATVIITGTDFNPIAANNVVKFNGVSAPPPTAASLTSLTVVVPAGATTGPISVTTGVGTSTSSTNFTVTSPLPTITSFTPNSGPVGTTVTISGTNFGTSSASNTIKFNGVTATAVSRTTATSLIVVVPIGATTGSVSVTTAAGTGTSSTDFTVTIPPPTITSFSPISGPPGTSVTIIGTNFLVGTPIVKFQGIDAVVTLASHTSITALVPVGLIDGPITVTIGGNTATSSINFTSPLPTITDFTPKTGPPGTTVTITGTNYLQTPIVKIQGATASVTSYNSTSIVVTLPLGTINAPFTVTVGGITVTSSSNFISPLPTITDFTPKTGSVGTRLTITGSNFTPSSTQNTIKFNGVIAATVSLATVTSLVVDVPIGATTGPISVTTAVGTGISSTNFTVTCPPISAPSAIGASRCGLGTLTLSASGATGLQEYRWYDTDMGGTSVGSVANFTTQSLSATTTMYVSIIEISSGCESTRTPVTATINTLPAPPTTTAASRCGDGTVTLTALGGTAGQYRWYTTETGGTAIAGVTNASYDTPTLTATTKYYVAINNGLCESTRTPVTATINTLPAPPTTTAASRCGDGTVTLTAIGGTAGQYRWYTIETGGTAIAGTTNASYDTPTLTTTTTYYVTINNGLCESTRTPVIATVNVFPAPPSTTAASRCGDGTVTLTAIGGTAGQYRWYATETGGAAIAGATNTSYNTPTLTTTTTYYVASNNGLCESERVPVVAIVNPLPSAPTTTSSARCGFGSVTLNAAGGTPGQYRWYSTVPVNTAISGEFNKSYTTPSLNTTTNYYVSIHDGTCESELTSITATVNPAVVPPAATSNSRCGQGSVMLFAASGTIGAQEYRWYNMDTGGTPLSSDGIYTTNPLSITSIFYLSVIDQSTGCESERTPVTATINEIPNTPIANSSFRCGPGSVTLSASGGADGQYRWFASGVVDYIFTGGVNESYTTPFIYSSITHYVSIHNGTCESDRVPLIAEIRPLPAPPSPSNKERCGPGEITFTASGATASQEYRWYNDYTGGTSLASTPTFTTPSIAVSSIYYVSILDPGGEGCESIRNSVEATVHTIPEPPLVIGPSEVCPGANVTVSASNSEQLGQYRWYENGSLLSSGNNSSYSISNIAGTHTLDVAFLTECESPKTSVTVSVVDCTLPPPQYPTVVASSGGYIASAQGSLAWTLGEVMTETYSTSSRIALTQGFHQPLAYVITELGEEELPDAVYPNPVIDALKIKIMEAGSYQLSISNLQGQLVYQKEKKFQSGEIHEISFEERPATLYILQLTNITTKRTELFKIIKQ